MTAHTRSRASTRLSSQQQNTENAEEKPSKRIKTEKRSTVSSVSSTTSIASTTGGRSHRGHHGHGHYNSNDTNDENNANSNNSNNSSKNSQKKANVTKNIISSDSLTFLNDERVLCYHGFLIYEAKILKGEIWENKSIPEENGPHYFVHYKGWKQTWDEWVPEERILKWTEENIKIKNSLKDAYSPNTRNHEKKSSSSNDNSKKKTRESSKTNNVVEPIRKIEMKLQIPEPLKLYLVDDWENITKDKKLVTLPRKPTVQEIINEYKKITSESQKDEKKEFDLISEMLDGVQLYFDKALGNILLYHFEREQYNKIQKEDEDRSMSKIYGAEHLIRLFVQFPFLLEETNLDQDSVTVIQQYMNDFLKFLSDNKKRFFLTEYESADESYISKFEEEETKQNTEK
ncbi:MRG-domain-containing protein [Neocallimastix lanati (nom. inval.)]|nr:MRG-domain-containing protein [Neocallimastix sp. JGI-2020a]